MLLGTTAIVTMPRAEAAGEILDPSRPDLGYVYYGIPALSADGTIFVGNVQDNFNNLYTGYYAHPDGTTSLPGFGNGPSAIYGMSGDARWVVGYSRGLAGYNRAFLWDAPNGLAIDLGLLYADIPNSHMAAHDVSGDGTRVVGSYIRPGMTRGFAWIKDATTGEDGNEQMYRLTGLDDANNWAARSLSDDGRYAAGYSDGNATTGRAVRWDLSGLEAGGSGADIVLDLGSLAGVETGDSAAADISADGRIVVGAATDADGVSRAFRWVEGAVGGVSGNVQMYDLGTLVPSRSDAESQAKAMSRDGAYIVGWSNVGEAEEDARLAFRWTEETGMESVQDWLARNGVTLDEGQLLTEGTAVSDDGRVIAGLMNLPDFSTRAFIARVTSDGPGPGPGPGPGGGLMDVEEYQRSLYAAAGIANAGEFLTWLPMNGAHHRPLLLTPSLSGDMCAWATGDFAQHGPSATGLALGEMGACTDLAGGNVRIGGGVGTSASWQDLALGGSMRMQGQYVLSEIDWQPDGTPLLLSLTGMLGSYHANIDRAYSNGAAVAMSHGETNAFGGVVRLRADWLEAATIGNTSINPYAALGFGGLHVDGYAESGGPFPATFNAQNLGHADIRVGVTAITEFSAQTKLSTTLEVAHRTGTGAAATGQVQGLFDFNLGGGSYGQTWARVGLELDHKIHDGLSVSASAHLASTGRDPSLAISAGLKGAF
ncbi:MAG: hypothetical protein ABS76_26240 [Pelagibacterium sp. SCN 64-44]|nr:MAG: hypothetical protein ABS76_26240 [Pelagibacterium sp. SCN 64-44]